MIWTAQWQRYWEGSPPKQTEHLAASLIHTNIIIPLKLHKQPLLLNFEWSGWSVLWIIPAQDQLAVLCLNTLVSLTSGWFVVVLVGLCEGFQDYRMN